MYQRIIHINRCLAIDKPELKIPWFMGKYLAEFEHEEVEIATSMTTHYHMKRDLGYTVHRGLVP